MKMFGFKFFWAKGVSFIQVLLNLFFYNLYNVPTTIKIKS